MYTPPPAGAAGTDGLVLAQAASAAAARNGAAILAKVFMPGLFRVPIPFEKRNLVDIMGETKGETMFMLSRRHAVGLIGATGLLARVPAAFAATPADADFAKLTTRALDGAFRLSPVYATYIGEHRYDGEIDDVGPAGRAKSLAFLKDTLSALHAIDRAHLSRANQVDAAILENSLRYQVWDLEVQQSWAWDPLGYNELAGSAVYLLIAREFAPLNQRLHNAAMRMAKVPALLAQARANLVLERVPRIHADTVAKQNPGIASIADGVVAMGASLPADDKGRLEAAAAQMKGAIAEHQKWIEGTLVPGAKGDFRIGAKLYDEKLAFALMSPLRDATSAHAPKPS